MSAAPERSEHRLGGLDGLRGIACLMVFLYHLRWRAQPSAESPIELPLFGFNGERLLAAFDAGVAIFFVLSGMLLSLPYWQAMDRRAPAPDLRRFLWRRVCRIAPAFFAVLLVVYLLRPGTYTLLGALDFFLHASFLHTFADESYYGVYPLLWTIGIEFQFYLLLPAIMAGLRAVHARAGYGGALTVMFAGSFFADWLAQSALGSIAPAVSDRVLSDSDSAVVGGTIFSYLKFFAFGLAAGLASMKWKGSSRSAELIGAGSIAAYVLLLAFAGREAAWRAVSLAGWPLGILLIALFTAALPHTQICRSTLSARPMIALGTVSYGIYLWHELVQQAVFGGTLRNHLSGWPLFLAGGLVAFAVTVAIATLSWRWIERPALSSPVPIPR